MRAYGGNFGVKAILIAAPGKILNDVARHLQVFLGQDNELSALGERPGQRAVRIAQAAERL
jgi:hypothetical protein